MVPRIPFFIRLPIRLSAHIDFKHGDAGPTLGHAGADQSQASGKTNVKVLPCPGLLHTEAEP